MRGQWPVAVAFWPDGWIHFAGITHLILGIIGVIIGALLVIWWSQQTGRWYAVFAGTLLFSMVLNVAAFYFFVVPPHSAGCIDLCPGSLAFLSPSPHFPPAAKFKSILATFS